MDLQRESYRFRVTFDLEAHDGEYEEGDTYSAQEMAEEAVEEILRTFYADHLKLVSLKPLGRP